MTKYELAINEEGEPFAVPPEVAGWRVRRSADGRGRPALVHARGRAKGKPLIVPVDASHADLFAAAGPGRYRLEAVDAEQHKLDGVPAACTGPLTPDVAADDGEPGDETTAGAGSNLETMVCHLVAANSRMVEKALDQMGTVMTGVAELLKAAHNAGITSRPPPPAQPPPVLTLVDDDQDGDDDEDDGDEEIDDEDDQRAAVATSGIPEMVQFIIKETIAKAVPLIFEKLGAGGASIAGLPLEAILDWRKAVPTSAPPDETARAAAAATPSAGVVNVAGPATGAPAATTRAADAAVSNDAPIPTHTGTAGEESSSGSVPAEVAAAPAASSPPSPEDAAAPAARSPTSPEDAAALLNVHIMRVWQGLAPTERARAGQLIAQLPPESRTALLAELARLSVPEAIARARAVIAAQTQPSLPPHSVAPSGDTT